jgi:hypothetical protein
VSGHERVTQVESEAPAPLPPAGAIAPAGAAALASAVGNRAFARAVRPQASPDGPTVQRFLGPLELAGIGGGIYGAGKARGWWGSDEVQEAESGLGDAAQKAASQARLTKAKEELAGNGRARLTINNQVLGALEDFPRLMSGGKKENAEKVVRHYPPVADALEGIAVPEALRPVVDSVLTEIGDGGMTARTLTKSREENIDLAKTALSTAAGRLDTVVAGATAPAPKKEGEEGKEAPPQLPADTVASLTAAAATMRAAITDVEGLGEKGDPADVIALVEHLDPQLVNLAEGAPAQLKGEIQTAGFNVRNAVRILHALQRTREENGEHAAQAFRKADAAARTLFQKLLEREKVLKEEIAELAGALAAMPGEEKPT